MLPLDYRTRPSFSRLLQHAGGYSGTILTPNPQGVVTYVMYLISFLTTAIHMRRRVLSSRVLFFNERRYDDVKEYGCMQFVTIGGSERCCWWVQDLVHCESNRL